MREYKFRGKISPDQHRAGEWVYGYYYKSGNRSFITEDSESGFPMKQMIEVEVESVGMYTGQNDKNDTPVYENDIYKRYNYIYQVVWIEDYSSFEGICIGREKDFGEGYEPLEDGAKRRGVSLYWAGDGISKIIGNTTDNPEFIKTPVL